MNAVPVNIALTTALRLAEEYGLPVLPCRTTDEQINGRTYKAKSPYLNHGFKDASANIEQITEWWTRWPDALIGVPTGKVSGLFVLDIDPRALDWYRTHAAELAAGRIHKTRRGFHLLYRHQLGLDCKSGALPDGVDVRAEGGYIIWWPGHGRDATGDLEDLTDPPGWVLDLLKQRPAVETHPRDGNDGIGVDRSADLLRRVARDVRAGLADYELLRTHLHHPHAQAQTDPARAVQRCIDKARSEPRATAPADGGSTEWKPPAFATYGASFDPAAIPLRRWLLGNRRSVGEVTVDAGPPGVNKSTLMLTDAVAIATGRQILADKVHETGAALYLAGEDARRDVEARLAGILEFYQIQPAELGERLHVVYLAEVDPLSYTLAQMVEDMAILNQQMLGWLRDLPDTIAVFVDPLMAWHRLMENSNEAVQLLSTSLRAIAAQGNRHVGIDHHVTKITMADPEGHVGNLASVRGAGSLIGMTRWAFTMARLNAETAGAHGIPEQERPRYRRLDSLKTSYGPDDEQMRLLRVESVTIANGESVPVLVEQDLQLVQAEAQERKAAIAKAGKDRLTEALTRMLAENRPRSANAAALWLITHAPELVTGKTGAALSEFTVRQRLPGMIGAGLPTRCEGQFTRIVIRPAAKNGKGSEIDFEEKAP